MAFALTRPARLAVGLVLAPVLLTFLAPLGTAGSAATLPPAASPPDHRSPNGTGALVHVGSIRPSQATASPDHPAVALQFHGGGQPTSPSVSTAAPSSVAGLTVPGPASPASGLSAGSAQVLTSLNSQVAALGSGQALEPPDTVIATDGKWLVEFVNASGLVLSVSGGTATPYRGPFDLNTMFAVPSGYSFSDPRIVYDPTNGRWLATGVAFSGSASLVVLGFTDTADPNGKWEIYQFAGSSNVIHDQPKLGVSGDQLVVSWNDFLAGAFFQGATTWVFDKLAVEAVPQTINGDIFGPYSNVFAIVPAAVVAGNTEYAVWNDADCNYAAGCSKGTPTLGVIAMAGTPSTTVTWTVSYPSLGATSNPPAAAQPAPGNPLKTNDDRLLGAVWSNGTLWTSGNDACTPPGDNTVRPCMRLIAASVTPTSATVLQDFDAGAAGASVMYPEVAVDGAGDMAVVYSASSSSVAAGVGTAGQAAGATGTLTTGPWIQSGTGAYVDGTSSPRWGDYSGAAAVPTGNTTTNLWGSSLWVAGEYNVQGGTHDWGTAAAALTFGGGSTPNTIGVSATPTTLTAGSAQTSTVTATVTNSGGAVNGDTVTFSASGPAGVCGGLTPTSATTGAGGTASVTYTAGSAAGTCTITATDASGGNGSATITQQPGSGTGANTITVAASPATLTAGSRNKSTVTATVTNNGVAVPNDAVTFAPSGTCGSLSPATATTGSGGTASTTYSAGSTAGSCTITATDASGGSGSTTITQTVRKKH